MKVCPRCGTNYNDDLSFCLEDGSALMVRPTAGLTNVPTETYPRTTNAVEDFSAAPTLVSNPLTPPKQFQMAAVNPSNNMGCIVTVGQVAAMLLIVIGLGSAGVYYVYKSDSELAYSSNAANSYSKPSNSAANSTATSGNYSSNALPPPPLTSANSNSKPAENSNSKTISGGVLNGKATSLPKPPYPPAAKAVRAQGSVSVQVLVDETGKVISASAVSGHPLLRAAAAAAAREARFSPTMLSGKAVKVSGVITYNFVME